VGDDDSAVIRRLRAQVHAVEELASAWERSDAVPEGFRCAWDVATAATEIRRELGAARRAHS
jgi:hypothetical protein